MFILNTISHYCNRKKNSLWKIECTAAKPGLRSITKHALFKYIEKFTTKNWKFSDKNSDIFHISAQNIDCGYSLEPPRRDGSNEYHNLCFWAEIRKKLYTPVNPSFTILKWGLRGQNYIGMFSLWIKRNVRGYSQTIANFSFSYDSFRRTVESIREEFWSTLLALPKWRPTRI